MIAHKKMQQILIIGFGSIGKRHYANLLEFGNDEISIVSRHAIHSDDLQAGNIFPTIEEAYSKKYFDIVFICTPTAQHIHDLKLVWNNGTRKIYIEKPISNNSIDIENFCKKIDSEKCTIVVGYDLHFDPGFMKVKELIEQNTIGKILSVNATVGQYLPDWRPDEDYKKGMSASLQKGGGVMLDLIHELDYLYDLFGKADIITAQKINSGSLGIETEELSEILIKFKNGILATIHMDYFQPVLLRQCRFTANNGSIFWDMSNAVVRWMTLDKNEFVYSYDSFKRNDRFKKIVQTFLSDPDDERLSNFQDASESLKMVLAAKKAAEEMKYIDFKMFNF